MITIVTKSKYILLIFSSILFVLLCISESYSQSNNIMYQSNQMRLANGIVRIAEPGQLADTVNVWGDVQNSGRFLIPKNTSLSKLISYAGGPVLYRTGDTVIDWSVVRLEVTISKKDSTNKNGGGYTRFIFSYSEKIPNEFNEYHISNDDVIIIQVKRKKNWRDYLQVISPIASTLTATILLYNLVKTTF